MTPAASTRAEECLSNAISSIRTCRPGPPSVGCNTLLHTAMTSASLSPRNDAMATQHLARRTEDLSPSLAPPKVVSDTFARIADYRGYAAEEQCLLPALSPHTLRKHLQVDTCIMPSYDFEDGLLPSLRACRTRQKSGLGRSTSWQMSHF